MKSTRFDGYAVSGGTHMSAGIVYFALAIAVGFLAIIWKGSRSVGAAVLIGAAANALGNQIGVIKIPELAISWPAVSQQIGAGLIAFLLGLCIGLAIALSVALKIRSKSSS
jgi:hypothetical protein